MASSTSPHSSVAAPARSSSSRLRQTDPNLPDCGAAIIVLNDAGEKVLTNGGKDYEHTFRTLKYDYFKCTACLELTRGCGWAQARIRTNVKSVPITGMDTDNPRLRKDPNGIHHFCCSDYTPTSAKRKATIDDNDRVAKRRRPEYEEDVAEPDIFGQAVRMKDGRSYGYWSEEKATMLLYKEDGKMSAEVPGAKDVYCVRCAELKPQYDCRAIISGGNFVLFDPAEGDGDNEHICLKEAGAGMQVQQPVVSYRILQEPSDGAPPPAGNLKQLAADVIDAPLDDPDAFLKAMVTHAGATETEPESQHTSVQPADSLSPVHSSTVVSPAVAGGSSVADSRMTSAARCTSEVVVLNDDVDEDAPASTASSAGLKADMLDASSVRTASAGFMQIQPSSTPPRTSTAPSAEPLRDINPPRVVPVRLPSGVLPKAFKDKASFGKAAFITEGSETYAVYKQELGGVEHKFKQLRTSEVTLEGETFNVGKYECYDCNLFQDGSNDAIGLVTVANGYFVLSHPEKPERIEHCCKPAP